MLLRREFIALSALAFGVHAHAAAVVGQPAPEFSLVDATGGQIVKTEVSGPMGVKVMASYGLLGDGKTAVIEMAEASGLPLVNVASQTAPEASIGSSTNSSTKRVAVSTSSSS